MVEFTSKHSLRLNQHNLIIRSTPSLEEHSYDVTITHVNINGILRTKHYDKLDKLPGNVMKVANTCQKYNIGKKFISAILPSTRRNINIFGINKKSRDLCLKYNFEFINHQQVTTKYLWNDEIHQLHTSKSILGQNFVNRVSNFFAKIIIF